MGEPVSVEVRGAVWVLTIERPEVRNCVDGPTALALGRAIDAFAGEGNPRLVLTGTEHVKAACAEGRGILFVGGHFANWELFEVALANLGLSGAKVLQHPSNPFVLGLIARHRYAYGLEEQIATGEGVLVVEWPEHAGGFAHEAGCLSITLEDVGEGRIAIVEAGADWLERVPCP